MKAISIHQPWASLITLGEKRFETRNWKPQHRGPIIFHASRSFSMAEQAPLQTEPFKSIFARHGITSITQLPTSTPLYPQLSDGQSIFDLSADTYPADV